MFWQIILYLKTRLFYDMNYRKWIPLILITISLPIIWYIITSWYPSLLIESKKLLDQIRDYGSVLSLILSIYILYIIDFPTMIIDFVKRSRDSAWKFLFLGLGTIALIGVWFAVRAVGFNMIDFVLDEDKLYKIENVFDVIGYLLTANFTFTLLRTFAKIGCFPKTPSENQDTTNDDMKIKDSSNEDNKKQNLETNQIVPKLITILIQGLLITLIAYVPRYSVEIEEGRFIEFVVFVTLFLFSALTLLFFERKIFEKVKE